MEIDAPMTHLTVDSAVWRAPVITVTGLMRVALLSGRVRTRGTMSGVVIASAMGDNHPHYG